MSSPVKTGKERSVHATFDVIRKIEDPIDRAKHFTEKLHVLMQRAVITRTKFDELLVECYEHIYKCEADDKATAAELWARTAIMIQEIEVREEQLRQAHLQRNAQMQAQMQAQQGPQKIVPVQMAPFPNPKQ